MSQEGQDERTSYAEPHELLARSDSWICGQYSQSADIFTSDKLSLDAPAFHAGNTLNPQLLDANNLCFLETSFDAPDMSSTIPCPTEHELGTDSFPASFSSLDAFSDMMNMHSGATSPGYGQPQNIPAIQSNSRMDSLPWSWGCDPNTLDPFLSSEPYEDPVPPARLYRSFSHLPQSRNGLPRRRSRYLVSRSAESSAPIHVPSAKEMNPMQRWQESPPEDEPASLTAIMNAMDEMPTSQSPGQGQGSGSRPTNPFRHYRQSASITSGEISASSADSACSSAGRSTPQSSQSRRSKGRIAKSKAKPWNDTKPRIFCCTFCCDRFRSKYDWVRHEKSLHLSLETWYCAPLGPSVVSQTTGREHCAYCNALDPSREHLTEEHNYEECQNLSKASRSFRRKDHLVQHLRHVHQVNTVPLLDEWKVETKNITSRCGFCDENLHDWDQRIEHIGEHFRSGCTMKDWQGDHGFPPSITAQLRNAFPPYLIGAESKSMIPFSSTNADVRDHYAQMSSRVDAAKGDGGIGQEPATAVPVDPMKSQFDNFLGNFTRHLGQFARQQMQSGVIPTDEMFQQEARRVIFDCEDAWDQTIADNPEWLSSFRRLHCDPEGPVGNG
ncbi:uncharacterized protein N7482_009187 [Penicillium canariense]|uniref:C2H2-type domain-containing protein n=1 Tax=Penicillium canariense TaxID=189055 RepID=A0A9W9LFH5_9EURO|nr:uncharacterized protein N7482_009187 [Penicillium canariense]KAJ5152709.1 hypothetical protein N7482_009187 [Penicillium canariense]